MRKTTIYLNDEEADGLRRLSRARDVSQAELIREAVRTLLGHGKVRTFHSLGKGAGDGRAVDGWDADELYETAVREA